MISKIYDHAFTWFQGFCLFLFLVFSLPSLAATKTWVSTAGGSWLTAANWSPSGVPASGDDIIIPALTNSTRSITGMPAITLNSLVFTGTGTAWLIGGASGNVVTISTTWTIPANFTLTIGDTGGRLVWTLAST